MSEALKGGVVIDVGAVEWAPWIGNYDVSRDGRVRNRKTNKELRPYKLKRGKHHRGHWRISVRLDGRYVHAYLHTAVLEAWHGPRPEGMVARHINDDKDDNRVENLAWGTRAQNYEDAKRNGRLLRGESAPWSILTENDVREILRDERSHQRIADQYGVARTTISSIKQRENWAWVQA